MMKKYSKRLGLILLGALLGGTSVLAPMAAASVFADEGESVSVMTTGPGAYWKQENGAWYYKTRYGTL